MWQHIRECFMYQDLFFPTFEIFYYLLKINVNNSILVLINSSLTSCHSFTYLKSKFLIDLD